MIKLALWSGAGYFLEYFSVVFGFLEKSFLVDYFKNLEELDANAVSLGSGLSILPVPFQHLLDRVFWYHHAPSSVQTSILFMYNLLFQKSDFWLALAFSVNLTWSTFLLSLTQLGGSKAPSFSLDIPRSLSWRWTEIKIEIHFFEFMFF